MKKAFLDSLFTDPVLIHPGGTIWNFRFKKKSGKAWGENQKGKAKSH